METVSIYVLTWNVATKPPEDRLNMGGLLGWDGRDSSLPDIYVIGLQEVKAQVQNIVLDAIFDDPWTRLFRDKLGEKGYVKIRTVRLQGLVLNVFVKRRHLLTVRDLAWDLVRTGLGGLWGNKGGVGIRMKFSGVSICLVNSHLPPHDHNLQARIDDYNAIVDQMKFPKHPPTQMIFYHDYVIWLGDNNFRLDESIPHDEVLTKIKANELEWLLERDQLNQVRQAGHAFSELTEPPFRFPPTFKFHFHSTSYDPKRRPAWTDRILYRVTENAYEDMSLSVTASDYTSLQDQQQSDHRPVRARMTITARSGHGRTVRSTYADSAGSPVANVTPANFSPVSLWTIDSSNTVSIVLGDEVEPNDFDWIGIYKANFTSLDDYVSFMYVNPRSATDSPRPSRRQGQLLSITFPDHSVRESGLYCLLYITHDWGSVLAVSTDFRASYANGVALRSGPSTPDASLRRHAVSYGSYPPIDSALDSSSSFQVLQRHTMSPNFSRNRRLQNDST